MWTNEQDGIRRHSLKAFNFLVRFLRTRELVPLFSMVMIACQGSVLGATGRGLTTAEAAPPRNQKAGYEGTERKTVVELQRLRQESSILIRSDSGTSGVATLINLSPRINVWYLLKVAWQGGSEFSYHLENPEAGSQKLTLTATGIEILQGQDKHRCDLFGHGSMNALEQAKKSQLIYAPLCENRLFLRNAVQGHSTRLEDAAAFLRSLWHGEKAVVLIHHALKDAYRETAETGALEQSELTADPGQAQQALPLPALIDRNFMERLATPGHLGIALQRAPHAGLRPGAWYPATGQTGIYLSVLEPAWIDQSILQSHQALVNNLDAVEAASLCYLVAFDLDRFELVYALGTDHPAVGWSAHIKAAIKDPQLPGPDGIGTISPLVSTGLVSPENVGRTVATFSGGFKRIHGAFKFGELATKNHGSHYGFVENGVVFSKLQPGLATIFVFDDGSVQMRTWEEQDDQTSERIKYARQNGVPLVEFDERSQSTVPGRLVSNWGGGNWSGSEDMKLRTIRSGAALQWNGTKRFLFYALFSDATPSAMARVFQAYRCRYGLLLDMNALEHTYLALYRRAGSQLFVDHLIDGMSQVEKSDVNGPVPRFLGYPDNRDFFYLVQRTP
jgi:hypothetical protein